LFVCSAHGYINRSTTVVPNSTGVALYFQALYRHLVIAGLTKAILNSVDCWFLPEEMQWRFWCTILGKVLITWKL